jgi:hypothetical protein
MDHFHRITLSRFEWSSVQTFASARARTGTHGSIIFATIGSTRKSRAALKKMEMLKRNKTMQ